LPQRRKLAGARQFTVSLFELPVGFANWSRSDWEIANAVWIRFDLR
jgi:hypothetical protein